jgi:hypothetical protein
MGNKAREINSLLIKQLIDETTPEELAKIDTEMTNNKQMKIKLKFFIARLLFGKPKIMSVYKDKNNNFYGSAIHNGDSKSYIHIVNEKLGDTEYVGETAIWI